MSEMATIARPYAKAAFDFAVEKGELSQWAQMLTFCSEVAKNEDVAQLLDGAIASEQLAEIFISICGEQLNEFGQNFINVMAENGRLKVLPGVLEQFILLQHEFEKVIDADVTSAIELTEQQKADIGAKLEARLERKVKLNCSVDETLLAGVIIRAGDLVIDNSARGRLGRLSETLQS
ncbi:F0F1 ATP synthase subunit delta [Aliivibrio fischeri]|uniref:ATP synthase subunit delta n=1 Tax=Aliivibrio fischeri (strain ATCC 700601 / ES114) TaxID=312309 RepID=ATPD_ALIF1|nr:F0F1 ATP synthase subunit delta [Aliivibrio fischeri]Q5E1N4.1 RecName: Full=ATP synthase subunit delta; AltName: Full=ATP synthase F(1) sector subunit delta; AltName: Full=F-type ATPase subunit delta; Short=F-ATPase subunit delta [Aliivibrio fischeri ES114]AAW87062.1 ATP synthase F1, delta subunit [Aliivibrio fischeri ES114]KLU79054.1 ATP F0F1 synthase subunit delta [Aliivibrio fischeri]MBP3140488.1 F0F1 ATP synthase subunit delta [Aliivibrio fischeri]MBP3156194.1 F0F1 ATP synthase subunit 